MPAKTLTFHDLRLVLSAFEASPGEIARRLDAAAANCSAAMALVERTEARLRGVA